jgi:DNA repair protein SbcD/Mre11
MRFLHTSDWHVGQKLGGRGGGSRQLEHEAVLAEIADIAVGEKVDCVLVSGDMFHSRSPQPEDDGIVISFFAELIRRRISAVAICGNHDNPRRLAAWRRILTPLGIHLCPEPAPPERGGVIRITAGNEQAIIAALPHVPQRHIVDAWRLFDPEQEGFKDYAERVAIMMNALAASFTGSTVNILVGHMFLNGAEASGSEWSVHIGLPYAVPPARIPATAQYVALGDLHRPQDVMNSAAPTRYAGSPLQLDFGEEQQRKSVTVVEAIAGRPAQLNIIPLTKGRSLRTIEGTIEELRLRSAEFGDDYLRVYVKLGQPMTGLADQIREFLPNAVQIRPKLQNPEQSESIPLTKSMLPEEYFAEWYLGYHTVPPPERIIQTFRRLHEEALHAAT